MAHTNLAKSKNAFEHVLGERILLVALDQTIAFCEAKVLCVKANLLRAKAPLPKVNLLLAKALLQTTALLDWSAPGLRRAFVSISLANVRPFRPLFESRYTTAFERLVWPRGMPRDQMCDLLRSSFHLQTGSLRQPFSIIMPGTAVSVICRCGFARSVLCYLYRM